MTSNHYLTKEPEPFYPSMSAVPVNCPYSGNSGIAVINSNAKEVELPSSDQDHTSTESTTMSQLLSLPTFTIEHNRPIDYNFYMVIHKLTGIVVSFGKFAERKSDNASDTDNFKVVRLNGILSSQLLDFLTEALGDLNVNDFVDVPPVITLDSILNAPDSIDGLVHLLIDANSNWEWFFHWLPLKPLKQEQHTECDFSIYNNFGKTILLLNELKASKEFMCEIYSIVSDQRNAHNDSGLDESNMVSARTTRNSSPADYFDCMDDFGANVDQPANLIKKAQWPAKFDSRALKFNKLNAHSSDPIVNRVLVPPTLFEVNPCTRTSSFSSSDLECQEEDDYLTESQIDFNHRIFEEALELHQIDPTYTIEEYEGFVKKNVQRKRKSEVVWENCNLKRLHVSNIPFQWDEKHLEDEFLPFGEINHCTIIRTYDKPVDQQNQPQIETHVQFLNQFQPEFQIQLQSLIDASAKETVTRSRGYGFITFKHAQDAEMAKYLKHGTWVCDLNKNGEKVYNPETNRKIEVNYAIPRNQRHSN